MDSPAAPVRVSRRAHAPGSLQRTRQCRGVPAQWKYYMAARPKLVRVSEEMRQLCALIERELLQWPNVTVRPMFGMRAFYRRAAIFAALPDKRAMRSPRAISYKLANVKGSDAGK